MLRVKYELRWTKQSFTGTAEDRKVDSTAKVESVVDCDAFDFDFTVEIERSTQWP